MSWGVLLKEAIKSFVKKPVTIPYPIKETSVPDGYRGLLSFDITKCIGCGLCSQVCPTGTIRMIPDERTKTKRRPLFELAKCVFCGSCVEVCPRKAISFTKNYHTAIIRKDEITI